MWKEGSIRIPAGCAIAGVIDKKRQSFPADEIVAMISQMHDRSNGLGGGFAVYGCYPEMSEYYALHLFFESERARMDTEEYLHRFLQVKLAEPIPIRKNGLHRKAPAIWRYFAEPKACSMTEEGLPEDDCIIGAVMHINGSIPGAFAVSSGKNTGAFKAVGYPEDVADFYRLEDYEGYMWLAHGRFPTNTPGWWGGAHPFTLLDWSVVHNGEISSYGANSRYLEMYGYHLGLQTDTEAITYLIDLLVRKHRLPLVTVLKIFTAPFWDEISRMDGEERERWRRLRAVYGSALLNGPFSVIIGCRHGMIAVNDRIKLRPLVAAEKENRVYVASEEAAIRAACLAPERIWSPVGGEPVAAWFEGDSEAAGTACVDIGRQLRGWIDGTKHEDSTL